MSFRFSVAPTALAVALLAVTLSPRDAHAFCRTHTTESFTPTAAKPCDDQGQPIKWPSKCVGYSVQKNASAQIDLATARVAIKQAFADWSAADCSTCPGMGAGNPSISFVEQGTVACNKAEYNENAGNTNVVTFWDSAWPHADGDLTLALTTVTYSVASGDIYDADIEINSNPTINPLTVGDPTGKPVYDLLSILAHETGHFFGLAHTQLTNTDATMFPKYKQGDSFMRTPAVDDVCGACTIYPPGRSATCDPTPHGGLVSECGGGPAQSGGGKGGCGCAVVGGEPFALGDAALVFGALALVVGLDSRQRARRARIK